MNKIREIITMHHADYLRNFGDKVPSSHRKVLDAIINCRTGKYGVAVFECGNCGGRHFSFNCCGNRHCPECQNYKNEQWLAKQISSLLPCHYFMITFTLSRKN